MRNPFARRRAEPSPDGPASDMPEPDTSASATRESAQVKLAEVQTLADTPPALEQADAGQIDAAQADSGQIGIEPAAEMLIAGGATRALFVSPEGDDGAAVAVMVAREIADAGLRVLLVDLTISGAASRSMLDTTARRGITDLLASEASFTEAVHVDLYSDCAVLPVGTADPARAMRAAARLPVIIRSLTTAYDVVVVECGSTDADGIRELVADSTEILVSAIDPDRDAEEIVAELKQRGYGRVTVVSPRQGDLSDIPAPERAPSGLAGPA